MTIDQPDDSDDSGQIDQAGQTGGRGANVNDSFASSAMNLEPDVERIKQYDTIGSPTHFILYIVWLVTVLILWGTVALFMHGHWVFGIVALLVSAFACISSYALLDDSAVKKMAYKDGLITPAIIVNTNPIELIALANMSFSSGDDIYGCQKLQVKSLPLHTVQLGEKIPCASLFMGTKKGNHKIFNPRPVCWGFDDVNAIQQALEAISADDDYEFFDSAWDMLAQVQTEMMKQPYGKIVYFDAHMQAIK